MKKFIGLVFAVVIFSFSFSQTNQNSTVQRPKLVVGIVVDQMRWDYLYRYYDRYLANGGFKKMINQGFSCENTFIPYIPTVTACGHSCIYTGSVPAIHGITGNGWWDRMENRSVYCTEDKTVTTVGAADGVNGKQSPRNLLANTICDELRIATNFRSKVFGIAIKDRGSILPAGHSANAAFWYDTRSGNWISSSYYGNELPSWVSEINAKKPGEKYYQQGWNTLYPIATYMQSTGDEKIYEGKPFGSDLKSFPYDLKKFIGTNPGIITSTPFGNSITFELAKAAVNAEKLGADAITDFLAVSFSSPDIVGHSFGPNSIEVEDVYLRLDKELGEFFSFLDAKVGKGQWLSFLSADHGVASAPGFSKENKLPGGLFNDQQAMNAMNQKLKEQFAVDSLIFSMTNYQVHINKKKISSNNLDEEKIKQTIIDHLLSLEPVQIAFSLDKPGDIPLPAKIKNMVANGYHPKRSGDVQFILKPAWLNGSGSTGTTHGLWNPYDSHIPLLWYGWNIKHGKSNREIYMTDIAATLAALLHIQMPNGCIGQVIEELVR